MSEDDRTQRAEALIVRMKAARGYVYPEWEFAARQDPDFVEAYNRLYELGLGEGRHVPAKVRSSWPSPCWRSAGRTRRVWWRT